jgi:hypothetical protein
MTTGSTSTTVSLMQMGDLPPIRYRTELPSSKNDLDQTIDKVASFVSQVYTKFLTLSTEERQQFKKQGAWIEDSVGLRPTTEECQKFTANLKQTIISSFDHEEQFEHLSLATDYSPKGKLLKVCESSFSNLEYLNALFPWKTGTSIMLNREKTRVIIDMDFRSPGF